MMIETHVSSASLPQPGKDYKTKLATLFSREAAIIAIIIFIGCLFLSTSIPPLKSPDEHDHIKRAYLLGKGGLVLDSPPGKNSGGEIDTGLTKYFSIHQPYQKIVSKQELDTASSIKWTGERAFDSAPGTGYYFPLVYLPQATGLLIGEWLDLSIDQSYKLARLLTLFTTCLILYAGFLIFPTNPLTLALIAIPMSLFQFSSASIDGITTSLAIFIVATFLRIIQQKQLAPNWSLYALAIPIVVLTTAKIHTLPILLLLLASFFYTKNPRALLLFIAATFAIAAWTLIAINFTVDSRVVTNASTSNIIFYYVKQPLQFFSVLLNTLSDERLSNFYKNSFLGILGWLDTPFKERDYFYFTTLISLIALLSLQVRNLREEWMHRAILAFIAISSVIFIFFALLVTWTPHPAEKISGVQGRYFLIPAIIFAYALAGGRAFTEGWQRKIAVALCLVLFSLSITSSRSLLTDRYFSSSPRQDAQRATPSRQTLQTNNKVVPSTPFTGNSSFSINLPPLKTDDSNKITRLAVLFGTHKRNNPWTGELVLRTSKGGRYGQEFSLSELTDNKYKVFDLPADHYVSAEIRSISGDGISVWELHSPDGSKQACVKVVTHSGQLMTVTGCP